MELQSKSNIVTKLVLNDRAKTHCTWTALQQSNTKPTFLEDVNIITCSAWTTKWRNILSQTSVKHVNFQFSYFLFSVHNLFENAVTWKQQCLLTARHPENWADFKFPCGKELLVEKDHSFPLKLQQGTIKKAS